MERPTVLLVDDDGSVLFGLAQALRGLDLRLLFASSADEALALLDREHVDVVATDYLMPGGDGLTLLRDVADCHPDTVRIMISGRVDLGVAAEAINGELVFRLLQKPFEREALRGALQSAVERLALERESRRLLRQAQADLRARIRTAAWPPVVFDPPGALPEPGRHFEDWPDEPLAPSPRTRV